MSYEARERYTSEQDMIFRAKWSQAAREAYHQTNPENFAGPDMSYPIKDAADVRAAWDLAGHASDTSEVRSKIQDIAKKLKLEDALPASAQADRAEESAESTPLAAEQDDDNDGDEGKNKSKPDANSEQMLEPDGDETVEKPVGRAKKAASVQMLDMPDTYNLYAGITRIDTAERIVEGVATSESIDSHGTIFGYDASKDAFQNWMKQNPNVREMHDRRAVGRGIGVFFDDANKQVIVRCKVSRAADDTWTKVLEGILTGYSIGAMDVQWTQVTRNSKRIPYAKSYRLGELSLVDAPSNFDAAIMVARADGLTDVIDITEEKTIEDADTTREGKKFSADSMSKIHDWRDGALATARDHMQTCGCDDCLLMDGNMQAAMSTHTEDPTLQQRMQETLDRMLAPVVQRMQSVLSMQAQNKNDDVRALSEQMRSLTATVESLVTRSLDEESLEKLKGIEAKVDRIGSAPAPGGPLLHGKVVERNGTAPAKSPREQKVDILRELSDAGVLNTPQAQYMAASQVLTPIYGKQA